MRVPTVGSLFAGIGGFDLGFERAGFETVWQVEIDDYCRRVLERHFPRAERFGDIRECGAHNLKPVDVICGGFPCQDISNAGKRAGIAGEQSGLWSEMYRVICELRPGFVLVENVSALLGRGIERVLGDLAAGGYDAEWDCIPACAVGAPHRRDRVWILAYPMRRGRRTEPWQQQGERSAVADSGSAGNVADTESECRQIRPAKGERQRRFASRGQTIQDAEQPRLEGHECGIMALEDYRRYNTDAARPGWWAVEPALGRVANGIPNRVGQLRGLGNAIVPQIAQWIAERIKADLGNLNGGGGE
jgi:DNA (cytosine-5)-methyltransferase 1